MGVISQNAFTPENELRIMAQEANQKSSQKNHLTNFNVGGEGETYYWVDLAHLTPVEAWINESKRLANL